MEIRQLVGEGYAWANIPARKNRKEAFAFSGFIYLYRNLVERFIEVYNNERPHQALSGAYPGEIYTPSPRVYEPPREPDYPFHDRIVRVTRCGRICVGKRKINLSTVFAGQTLGIREVDDQIWLVSFMHYDLGFFDKETDRVEPGPNPFAPEKL